MYTGEVMDKKIYKQLQEIFPKEAYKELNFGRKMTTIDAYHIVDRLNDVFGMSGLGWGLCDTLENGQPVGKPEIVVHTTKETKTLAGGATKEVETKSIAAFGTLWYKIEDKVYGVVAAGDANIMKNNVAEAYKKVLTNLISKAASYIGVGLSVYQGKGYDDPYLDRAAQAAPKSSAKFAAPKKVPGLLKK